MSKEAREKHQFSDVPTADGKVLYKDVIDNKIKLYYVLLFILRGCGRYLEIEKKSVANLFVKIYLFYWDWVTCFHFCELIYYFTGNAPLIFNIFNNVTNETYFYESHLFLL